MNLAAVTEFVNKSGLRKITTGLYMFTAVSFLLHEKTLPAPEYVQIASIVVVALMSANAFEHHTKTRGKQDDKPAAVPASPVVPQV